MSKDKFKPEIRFTGYTEAWEQRKVSEITKFHKQGYYTTESYDENKKYYLLRGTDLTENKLILKDTPKINATEKDYQAFKTELGDFLIVRSGTVGTYGIVDIDIPAIFGSYLIDFRFDLEQVANEFFGYFYQSDFFKKQLRQIVQQSANTNINAENIKSTSIALPCIAEQKTISMYLGHIDHLITLHQRELKTLTSTRKAMVDKMFPQNGDDTPAVRFEGYTEPWIKVLFSEIFTERHIIDTISDEYPQLSFTIEEGVIRPEDRKTNKRDFLIIDKANKKYLQTEYNDIIYNPANIIYGAIHRNALCRGCVSPIYKIFYTNQDSAFMECIVRHPRFIKEISRNMEGTVKKLRTLKPKAFLEMSAYIAPTLEEQRKIGEYFQQIDRLIEFEKEELEKIQHIKSACLDKMFV